MPTKLQRQLDLIAYLVSRRLPVGVEELMALPAYAAKWQDEDQTSRDSARRMFERDKDELRRTGIPLKTLSYTFDGDEAEGYVIDRRDFYLPYLKLMEEGRGQAGFADRARVGTVDIKRDDAQVALQALQRVAEVPSFPLAAEARSAFRKLAFDLQPEAFQRDSPVLFLERPGAAELSTALRTLTDALLARKRVRFGYHGIYRGEATERNVAPYGLLFQHGHWYLIGHDATRAAVRVFRVGRMDAITANTKAPNTPDYTIPDDFTLNDYVHRQAWELGDRDEQPIVARVRFRFPQSLWAARNRLGELEREEPGGAAVRRFEVHQVNAFVRWLLSLEGDAEILEPPELQTELRALARGIADAHTDPAT